MRIEERKMFKDRFSRFLESVGETPQTLAKKLNVGVATVYRWKSGETTPKVEELKKLKEIYPTLNLNALITGEGKLFTSPPIEIYEEKMVRIPISGEVKAGDFEYHIYDEPDYEDIPESLLPNHRQVIVLRVRGKSMHPAIPEGAVAVFVRGIEPKDGSVCLVVDREDGTATMKKVRFISKNKLLLIPLNPEYEERIVDRREVIISAVLKGFYKKEQFF